MIQVWRYIVNKVDGSPLLSVDTEEEANEYRARVDLVVEAVYRINGDVPDDMVVWRYVVFNIHGDSLLTVCTKEESDQYATRDWLLVEAMYRKVEKDDE